jgi:hypothetical protein
VRMREGSDARGFGCARPRGPAARRMIAFRAIDAAAAQSIARKSIADAAQRRRRHGRDCGATGVNVATVKG